VTLAVTAGFVRGKRWKLDRRNTENRHKQLKCRRIENMKTRMAIDTKGVNKKAGGGRAGGWEGNRWRVEGGKGRGRRRAGRGRKDKQKITTQLTRCQMNDEPE